MKDELNLEALREGSQQAFRRIFEQYHARMCHFAAKMLSDSGESEDVVQEAFIKMWEHRMHFETMDALRAFLYTTIRNRCLNIYKHAKVVRKYGDLLQPPPDTADAIGYLIEAEVVQDVNKAVNQLPPGCRNVLHLSYFEGLRNKDIAEQLNVSVNTVKTQKQRALQLLRGMLKVSPIWYFFHFLDYF